MLHERIAEAVHHVGGELQEFLHRQVQSLHQFLEHHLVDKLSDERVLAALLHGVQAAEIAYRRKHGVRTVEKGHLALVIRGLARNEKHVEPCLVGRELCCDLCRGLDNPEVEYFRLVEQIVLIAGTLAELGGSVARIARNDAVHEGAIDSAGILEPVAELLAEVPELDIFAYAALQFLSIQEDKFTREDDETFGHIPLKVKETVI